MKEHKELREVQILNIKKRAIEFTCNTLGSECPNQKCYLISYPLSIHLANNGFLNSVKAGTVNKGKTEARPHYWINLDYKNEFIIDTTARQFNGTLGYVHFGDKLADDEAYYCDVAFKEWSDDLMDNFKQRKSRNEDASLLPQHRILTPPIESYIKISIKSAIILIKDKKPDCINKKFVGSVCQASRNFYNENPDKLSNFEDAVKFLQFCSDNNIPEFIKWHK